MTTTLSALLRPSNGCAGNWRTFLVSRTVSTGQLKIRKRKSDVFPIGKCRILVSSSHCGLRYLADSNRTWCGFLPASPICLKIWHVGIPICFTVKPGWSFASDLSLWSVMFGHQLLHFYPFVMATGFISYGLKSTICTYDKGHSFCWNVLFL